MNALSQRAVRGTAIAAVAAAISCSGAPALAADPPGNNGTVKIAGVGDLDRIPNNTPHQSCTFQVQWYGYDKGADVISHVTFSAQAPTADVTIAVNGPSTVFVGGDAASGAGTATGLDGTATYTLSFSGGAPAKQGFHVRLVVATPHSLGNDTKSKVFWVGPCPVTPTPPPSSGPSSSPQAGGNIVPLSPVPQSKAKHLQAAHVKLPSKVSSGLATPPPASSLSRWDQAGLAGLGLLVGGAAALAWRRRTRQA